MPVRVQCRARIARQRYPTRVTLEQYPAEWRVASKLIYLNLDLFSFHNIDPCEPPDADVQAWLASIPYLQRTGVPCRNTYLPYACYGDLAGVQHRMKTSHPDIRFGMNQARIRRTS